MRRGLVEKHVEALVIAHWSDVQLRTDRFLLSSNIAWGMGLELQNRGV